MSKEVHGNSAMQISFLFSIPGHMKNEKIEEKKDNPIVYTRMFSRILNSKLMIVKFGSALAIAQTFKTKYDLALALGLHSSSRLCTLPVLLICTK